MVRRNFIKTSLVFAGWTLSYRWLQALAAEKAPSPKALGLTTYVSEFIVNTKYEDIPEGVLTLGKKTILDGFGNALAGSVSVMAPRIRQYIETLGVPQAKASVIGTRMKASPRFAALANGISIHGDDYDDVGSSALHTAAPVLPAAFALCESGSLSGKDLMLAFHVGVEVENKIGAAIAPRHKEEGFHTTGTCGSFGSAASCAKLRGLNRTQTVYALGIAASEASGLEANVGSMTKSFQAGHAAENGTVAADLAALGWTAADDILEAPRGFFQAAGGGFDPNVIMNRLGHPWMFASPGDYIKRFPCGGIQQSAMDEMLHLIVQYGLVAEQVERVEVGGNQRDVAKLAYHRPKTALEAKFSMEFCISILLLERKAGLSQFTDAIVQRADVQDMIRRVSYYADPEFDNQGAHGESLEDRNCILKIYTKDRKVLLRRTGFPKGSPENPMTYDEVAEKFKGNAEYAQWPAHKAQSVIEVVESLERESDVSRLTAALTA